MFVIQLFWERLSGKMCTRQSRKVIWDMINTLFLTLQLSNLLLLLSFSIRKHTSMASRAILSNFFEEQRTQNNPQYFSGLPRALSPTTFLEIAVYGCSSCDLRFLIHTNTCVMKWSENVTSFGIKRDCNWLDLDTVSLKLASKHLVGSKLKPCFKTFSVLF